MPRFVDPKTRAPRVVNMVEVRRTDAGTKENVVFVQAGSGDVRVETGLKQGDAAVVDANNPAIRVWLEAGLLERVDGVSVVSARDETVAAVETENAELRAEIERLKSQLSERKPRREREEHAA